MTWQDIATAPKDGTTIIVFRSDAGIFFAHFVAPNDYCDIETEGGDEPDWFSISGDHLYGDEMFTLWHPLPATPSEQPALNERSSTPIEMLVESRDYIRKNVESHAIIVGQINATIEDYGVKCGCDACKTVEHASDCAVHREPAMPKGRVIAGGLDSLNQK